MNVAVKDHVKDKKKVNFKYFQNGSLYYETELGLEFEVPVSETGNGVFKPQENAINFMKWIDRQLDMNDKAKESCK